MHIVESGLIIAVIAGLSVGIGLIIVFAMHFQPTLVTIQTATPILLPDRPDEVSSEEWE